MWEFEWWQVCVRALVGVGSGARPPSGTEISIQTLSA